MRSKNLLGSGVVVGLALFFLTWLVPHPEAQPAPPAVQIDADDIGGVVTGKNGPEAGVWVIAQTRELGTRPTKVYLPFVSPWRITITYPPAWIVLPPQDTRDANRTRAVPV